MEGLKEALQELEEALNALLTRRRGGTPVSRIQTGPTTDGRSEGGGREEAVELIRRAIARLRDLA